MTLYTWSNLASVLAFILLPTPSTKVGLLEAGILCIPAILWYLWKKPESKPERLPVPAYLTILFLCAYLGWHFFQTWSSKREVIAFAAKLHLSADWIVMIGTIGLSVFAARFFARLYSSAKTAFDKGTGPQTLLYLLSGSAVTVILSQIMIDTYFLSMGLFRFLWCCLCAAVVILLIFCLSGRIQLSVAFGSGLMMLLSTGNGYIYRFRGRLLDPLDVFSLGTAMNVAENYDILSVPPGVLAGWLLWIGGIIILFRVCPRVKERLSRKNRLRLGVCLLAAVLSLACYTIPLKTYHWDKQGAEQSGFLLNFVSNLKEVCVAKPKGYSPEEIQEISEKYTTPEARADAALPHIIVIMDEAFSDLSVFGELSTNIEPMPYISSLMEQAVSGYALSSAYGGNTANSEFEVLTGNSMAWMSPNAVPYQQYLNSPAFSMVSYLKSVYGYHSVAMHPYLSSGWNRPNAYQNLGFEECFFLESFPQEDIIREYVSDREMFETLIQTYESRREEPLFLFGVTMQNHGGYSYSGDDFTPCVLLQGLEKSYSQADQYLSLIHETDQAVEYLTSYFSGVEDDVVILFFGDHQPRLDGEFYNIFPETASDSLDDLQRKYMVPFFIWANYPLEAETVDCTSLSYLSTYLYEAAGIPLPGYNQFLSQLEQVIPAINANGYYSHEQQRYLQLGEAEGTEETWLRLYQQLQYNNLFDRKHRSNSVFPLLP